MRARNAHPILSCFSQPNESKRAEKMLELTSPVFSGLDESKADKLTLEPILDCFYSLDESQRCSPYPGLFSHPNESKRAKKMLELAIHKSKAKQLKSCLSSPCPKVFSGLDKSKKTEKPTLDLS
jgi:hypothetical protein